ncbi:MAG: GNAT family N-acetyltransferase [Flavobacteriales bacterium]|nr:GNAT family N-acetyltransferase [Flavobacteriales bacterium]
MTFQIKTYTPPQLLEFINSEEFKHLDNYPITRHRALSHINNPRSSDTDKILYIAFEQNKIVGYRLIMVDSITIDNQTEKVGWYSCVWVHPQKRGASIAKKLVEISLKDWGNNIIFQGPVTASKNLYTSTNLFNEVFITGLRAYSRFDSNEVITSKKPSLKPFSFLFKIADGFMNLFIDSFSTSTSCPANVEVVNEIDDETIHFIEQHQNTNLFKRSKAEFNWIFNYPWVLASNTLDHVSANYHFSSIAKDFRYLNIKFYNDNKEIAGFVTLQIRDKHLSVFNAYSDESQTSTIINYIYHIIKKNKTSSFSIYNRNLIDYILNNPNPFIFKKSLKRGFYYSKNFEHYFKKNPQLSFEAGDGDMIFT